MRHVDGISGYTVTTKESLRGGGMVGVTIRLPMTSSNGCMSAYEETWPDHPSTWVYVGSKYNPADAPSRGIYPPTSLFLQPILLPPGLECFIINSQFPFAAAEYRAHREGSYLEAATRWFDNAHQTHSSVTFTGYWPGSGCDIIGVSNGPVDMADHIRIVLVTGWLTVGLAS